MELLHLLHSQIEIDFMDIFKVCLTSKQALLYSSANNNSKQLSQKINAYPLKIPLVVVSEQQVVLIFILNGAA